MKYAQLSSDYKYDTIASAIYSREIEYFHYEFDVKNFKYLIENSNSESFKSEISKRLEETLKQMESVKLIVDALYAQIDNDDEYREAVDRAINSRLSKEGVK